MLNIFKPLFLVISDRKSPQYFSEFYSNVYKCQIYVPPDFNCTLFIDEIKDVYKSKTSRVPNRVSSSSTVLNTAFWPPRFKQKASKNIFALDDEKGDAKIFFYRQLFAL